MVIDNRDFRSALGTFLTGVTVVTAMSEEGPRGFTANSFTSVSLDPPLVLVCLSRFAHSFGIFSRVENFSINILSDAQRDISGIFASKAPDKFDRVDWTVGRNGAPALDGVTTLLECRRHDVVEAGDHVILIGEVTHYHQTPQNPLGYYRGGYVSLGLSQESVAASGAPLRVGAILESDGSVALLRTDDGYALPTGTSLGPNSDESNLHRRLEQHGLNATLNVLFSVFEEVEKGHKRVSIYYRGTVDEAPGAAGIVFVPLGEIAGLKFANEDEARLLARYVRERREDTFAIFSGRRNDGTFNRVVA